MRISRVVKSLLLTVGVLIAVSVGGDDASKTPATTDQESQPQRLVFEARIRKVAPDAIQFHGGFVLPTNRMTAYLRETTDGESVIARKQLEQLTEEVDEEPYQRPVLGGGDIIPPKIPSFKLGGRVRCEYIPCEAATKFVVLADNPEERRPRWRDFWTDAPQLDQLGDGSPNCRFSLKARALPLKDALESLARSAHLPLEIDVPALTRVGIDLNGPITTEIVDQPIYVAFRHLIDWSAFSHVYYGGSQIDRIRISSFEADQERRKSTDLPDWVNPEKNQLLYPQRIVDGQVVSLLIHSPTDEILSQLKSLPELRELDIHSLKGATPKAFAALTELDSVEQLSLRGSPGLASADADQFARQIGRMKSLRRLSLSETGITDAGLHEMSGLPLDTLTLYQEGRLTDEAMEEIARMTHLKSLGIIGYVATQDLGAMQFSSSALGRLSALPELERITFAGQPVPKGLSEFRKLKSLQFDGPTQAVFKSPEFLNDDAAADLAEAAHLKYLTIERHGITAPGWWMIGNLPELCGIRLSAVSDRQIKSLAAQGMPKLTQLQLVSSFIASNELTDTGIGYLTRFTSLNRLDLSGTKFTLESLAQLKDLANLRSLHLYGLKQKTGYLSLRSLEKLQELHLIEVPISQTEYNELERALPNTRIYAGAGSRWLWSIRDQQ